jgi:hypothetical protein
MRSVRPKEGLMQGQLRFDHRPRRKVREVRDTSVEAYGEVMKTATARQLSVLKALEYYVRTQGESPTSYELLKFMQRWKPELDLNGIRPRLNELKSEGMRYVEECEKRLCRVTGKKVYIYRATERGKMFLESKR